MVGFNDNYLELFYMIYIISNPLHTSNFSLTVIINHLFEMNVNIYKSYIL